MDRGTVPGSRAEAVAASRFQGFIERLANTVPGLHGGGDGGPVGRSRDTAVVSLEQRHLL